MRHVKPWQVSVWNDHLPVLPYVLPVKTESPHGKPQRQMELPKNGLVSRDALAGLFERGFDNSLQVVRFVPANPHSHYEHDPRIVWVELTDELPLGRLFRLLQNKVSALFITSHRPDRIVRTERKPIDWQVGLLENSMVRFDEAVGCREEVNYKRIFLAASAGEINLITNLRELSPEAIRQVYDVMNGPGEKA